MKAFRSTLAALALLASSAGIATAAEPVVKVGSDLTYPPYDYFDAGNKPAGFDVAFMDLLAKAGGFQDQFVDTRFASLILGLAGHKFDVIASALYVTPARAQQIDFIAYMKTGDSIAVAARSSFRPATPDALCGKRVGLIKGAAYIADLQKVSQAVCSPKGTQIDIREFPTSPEATEAVLAGNVDAQVDDSAVLKTAADKTDGAVIISSTDNLFPVVVGLGINKNDAALKDKLNAAFAKIKADGSYAALLKSYNVSLPDAAEIAKALGE